MVGQCNRFGGADWQGRNGLQDLEEEGRVSRIGTDQLRHARPQKRGEVLTGNLLSSEQNQRSPQRDDPSER